MSTDNQKNKERKREKPILIGDGEQGTGGRGGTLPGAAPVERRRSRKTARVSDSDRKTEAGEGGTTHIERQKPHIDRERQTRQERGGLVETEKNTSI